MIYYFAREKTHEVYCLSYGGHLTRWGLESSSSKTLYSDHRGHANWTPCPLCIVIYEANLCSLMLRGFASRFFQKNLPTPLTEGLPRSRGAFSMKSLIRVEGAATFLFYYLNQ